MYVCMYVCIIYMLQYKRMIKYVRSDPSRYACDQAALRKFETLLLHLDREILKGQCFRDCVCQDFSLPNGASSKVKTEVYSVCVCGSYIIHTYITHIYTHTHILHMRLDTHIPTHIYITHTYTHSHVYIYIYTYIHIYIYTYIYTYTRTTTIIFVKRLDYAAL